MKSGMALGFLTSSDKASASTIGDTAVFCLFKSMNEDCIFIRSLSLARPVWLFFVCLLYLEHIIVIVDEKS